MLINLLPLVLNNWRVIVAVIAIGLAYWKGYRDGRDGVLAQVESARAESQAKANEVATEFEAKRETIKDKTETAKRVVYETRVSSDCRHGVKRLQSYNQLIDPAR